MLIILKSFGETVGGLQVLSRYILLSDRVPIRPGTKATPSWEIGEVREANFGGP